MTDGVSVPEYLRRAQNRPQEVREFVSARTYGFRARVRFEKTFCESFEEGVNRLIWELAPRRSTDGNDQVYITECEEEEGVAGEKAGLFEVAFGEGLVGGGSEIPTMISLSTYLATMSWVRSYRLLDITFPTSAGDLRKLSGPQYGAAYFVDTENGTSLGAVIKPRLCHDTSVIRAWVRCACLAKLDYIADDEVVPEVGELSFSQRVTSIMDECSRHADSPRVIVNVAGSYEECLERTTIARDLGVNSVMVNVNTMGYDALQAIVQQHSLPCVANAIGVGTVIRGPDFGIAIELIGKLARMAGADAFYTGPFHGALESRRISAGRFHKALARPLGSDCGRRKTAAMMAGGVGLPEAVANRRAYPGALCLSLGHVFSDGVGEGHDPKELVEAIREVLESAESGLRGLRESLVRVFRGKGALARHLRAEEVLGKAPVGEGGRQR
jgi:ribulose 1,5-bisphosphate carboxylase large subunit-like protein